ncbi:MAG TPA: CoA-transferase [bacterium]|nr:CoA-transferase [bacterium]
MNVSYSPSELLAVSASRLLADGKVVFAGVGTPLLASALARVTHAPGLTIVVEGGAIGLEVDPGRLPISTNEMRGARRAVALPPITQIFLYAQRGYFDYGFLGGAQIDPYGNINTSVIGPVDRPKVRLPGSGGACDIACLCREIMIVTRHERRRFVERLDFVTSPGQVDGEGGRRGAGLLFGRVTAVVTDLALMDFDPTSGRMRLVALQPGAEREQVQEQTGFTLEAAPEVRRLEAPTEHELTLLRGLDPGRIFL